MKISLSQKQIIKELLSRRIEKAYPSKKALEKLLLSGRKLRLYQGFDPSSPNLHIGHLAGLLVLKQFQELGHEVIFLIGDFTGMIGDPTGKSKTRVQLSPETVAANAKTYQDQASLVLNFKGPNAAKMKFNSEWSRRLTFAELLKLASHLTVQQLIERDMFQARLKNNQEIFLSEFLYPLIQGNDSLAMDVDLELGGSDQIFNMLIGRKLAREISQKEKFVAAVPLLVDNQGKKIGKSEGNAINLINPANEFYGQIMSLNDSAILPCLRHITELPMSKIHSLEKKLKNGLNPMTAKKKLALELTRMIHGQTTAQKAQTEFESVHQQNQLPEKIKTVLAGRGVTFKKLLVDLGFAVSNSEAKHLIASSAVTLQDKKITDPDAVLNQEGIIKVGKRKIAQIKFCK